MIGQAFIGSKILSANFTLTGTDSGKGFVNTTATGPITISLPKAAPGLIYQFLVVAAQTITVQPIATDAIRGSAAGVPAVITGVGTLLILECLTPGFWEIYNEGVFVTAGGAAGPVFQTGTFAGTLTGYAAGVPVTVTYTIIDNMVLISIPQTTGTSNATSMTLTGVPNLLKTITLNAHIPINLVDNGSNVEGSVVIVAAGGTWTFTRSVVAGTAVTHSTTGFTAAGVKGTGNTVFTYQLT